MKSLRYVSCIRHYHAVFESGFNMYIIITYLHRYPKRSFLVSSDFSAANRSMFRFLCFVCFYSSSKKASINYLYRVIMLWFVPFFFSLHHKCSLDVHVDMYLKSKTWVHVARFYKACTYCDESNFFYPWNDVHFGSIRLPQAFPSFCFHFSWRVSSFFNISRQVAHVSRG